MNELFVVEVSHHTGHGDATDVILVTNEAAKAVRVARAVGDESLGYTLLSDEVGVSVVRLEPERVYCKSEFKWHIGDSPPRPVFFSRRHTKSHSHPHPEDRSCWTEEWFDQDAKKEIDGP